MRFPWKTVQAQYALDPFPIPATKFRNGYMGDRHSDYWLSGLQLHHLIKHVLLRDFSVDVASPPAFLSPFTLLDFGGSTGRLARHWTLQTPSVQVIASDTNMESVAFLCRTGMAGGLHQAFHPPLHGLPQESLSLVTALSVWTHMTEQQALGWLVEVRRVLRPGGFAWITVMSNHTWTRLRANGEADLLYSHIVGGAEQLVLPNGTLHQFTANELAASEYMPYPFTVFQGKWNWPYTNGQQGETMVNTFVTYEYAKTHWGAVLDLVAIYPQSSLLPTEDWPCVTPACPPRNVGQDVLLLRKPLMLEKDR